MISEWRRQSKSAGLWQYQTFRHGPILYWTASCALCARNTFFSFSRVLRSFWWGHMRCVRLEWRTDWIDCERSLFTPCSLLRRRNVKQSSVASAASSVALHGLPETSLRAEDWIQSQEQRSQLLYSITRIRLWIAVDSLLQVSHLKTASNMVSSEVSIISRINWYIDRSTAVLCVSVKRHIRIFDIRRVV